MGRPPHEEDGDNMDVKVIVSERLVNLCNISRGGYEGKHGSSPPHSRWSPHPLGLYKLNIDGSCRPKKDPSGVGSGDSVMRGPGGYGGIIRDHNGKWVQGFQGFVHVTDCLTTEFNAIYHGLRLLDDLGYKDSILESDSAAAVKWVCSKSTCSRSQIIKDCWWIIAACKHLILKNRINVTWVSREENKCADKLANMAIEKHESYLLIKNLPDEIKRIVDFESPKNTYENNGFYRNRRVISTRCGQKTRKLLPTSPLLL